MNTVDRQALGRCGEDLALSAYAALGYACLARRWRTRRGELDLVLRRGGVLVFCEVKTRRGLGFGRPEESVSAARLRRMRTVARAFLAEHAPAGVREYRFDVAAVLVDGRREEVRVQLWTGIF